MTIVPSHLYYIEGVKKGRSPSILKSLIVKSSFFNYKNIPYIHDVKHLSHLLGCSQIDLTSIIKRNYSGYRFYTVPKYSGGVRFINSPNDFLKKIQRWINFNILSKVEVHPSCYSFHKNSSIKNCAEKHCGAKWLVKIDIENFFEMVSEVEVYKQFRKLGYKPIVSFALSRICTYEPTHLVNFQHKWINYNSRTDSLPFSRRNVKFFGRLPQGAPTSPMLSNLVLSSLDEKVTRLIRNKNGIYTRYADDIFISFSEMAVDRKFLRQIIGKLISYLNSFGYQANKTKIKIISPRSTKLVLGLNVAEDKVFLQKKYKNNLESHIYGMKKFGLVLHAKHRKFDSVLGMIDHINGMVNYASYIEPMYGNKLKEKIKHIVNINGLG
ncbi:Retron-type reverse transcriptase [Serratia liquefaciens]|uniref:reverse transcriptase family protein n=1 Tax=Serratia liquefaciens TaxID=614 RepID=UPI002179F04F|nr:reverse transcriptase family protein [Serratia liquefaciens]CAI1084090.1 Retron-type reverse transcriptase [Serratia liquefaciens]